MQCFAGGFPVDELDFDASHTLEGVDGRGEADAEGFCLSAEFFGPFTASEGDSAHDGSMLSDADGEVSSAFAHGFGRFGEFDLSADEAGLWIFVAEGSESGEFLDGAEVDF